MNWQEIKDEITEFLHVVFLRGIRDWIDAGKVKKLRNVERELFFKYIIRLSPIYIDKDRKGLDYPHNNFFFGEMPYSVAREVVEKAEITKKDVVYDLGCGRGKFLFFTHLSTGATCIGVDLLPTYIRLGEEITQKLNLHQIHFYREDMLNLDLLTAHVVLIHGATFSPEIHEKLWENLFRLKPGSRFITVAIPYHHPHLELIHRKRYLMNWGFAWVYIYKVVNKS